MNPICGLWLYADRMNLHGDRGNMMALSHIAEAMQIPFHLQRANSVTEITDWNAIDFIYIGPGQMDHMSQIASDFQKCALECRSYIEHDGHVLVIGSSGCLFAKQYVRYDGSKEMGLGILDMTAKELNRKKMPYVTNEVYGDDLLCRTKEGMELVGCQIQCMDFQLQQAESFATVLYGYGNNTTDQTEGARYKNLIFTNLVGPLFSCNPWLGADWLLKISKEKGNPEIVVDKTKIDYWEYAKSGMVLKKKFIKEKYKLPGICSKI